MPERSLPKSNLTGDPHGNENETTRASEVKGLLPQDLSGPQTNHEHFFKGPSPFFIRILAQSGRLPQLSSSLKPGHGFPASSLQGSPQSQGKFEYWVAALKPGVVIFEINVDSEADGLVRTTTQ